MKKLQPKKKYGDRLLSAEILCCGGPSGIASMREGCTAPGAAGLSLRARAEAACEAGMTCGDKEAPGTRLVAIRFGHCHLQDLTT